MQPLPIPDQQSLAHSERCALFLREQMTSESLSFAEFMSACLYTPGLGYYAAGSRKFGAGGDFVTAPEISPVFSRVLARQVSAVLAQVPDPVVLEMGAGSGVMAVELFRKLEALETAPDAYLVLEISPDLRERQQQLVAEELPDAVERFQWIDDIPPAFSGVIVANEVLDALPVERFEIRDGKVLQHRVAADDSAFVIETVAAPDLLESAVRSIESDIGSRLPDGYCSEICIAASDWTSRLVGSLQQGALFLFDYGTGRSTYYAPDRSDGWLRCHFRHHAHNDALVYPGIQDITAWVDFSLVADAAVAAGADIGGFVTQAHFLMAGGLDAELQLLQDAPLEQQLELSSAIKTLTLPGEMGEHVKCLGLLKGDVRTPDALTMMDITHTL